MGIFDKLFRKNKPKPDESPGVGLRKLALTTSAEKLGFTPNESFPNAYGVLTDWEIGENFATIMSMCDGTASLYTNSTFGVIGGQGHERVREAAKHYVKTAEQYINNSQIVTKFPYPPKGQVYFYILTFSGVRLCVGNMQAIENGTDPAYPLFVAAQNTLTELRLSTEQRSA